MSTAGSGDLPHFFDTNILLYLISRDPSEPSKRERAIDLLDRDDGRLSVQVLQEFYMQAARPIRPDPLPLSPANRRNSAAGRARRPEPRR